MSSVTWVHGARGIRSTMPRSRRKPLRSSTATVSRRRRKRSCSVRTPQTSSASADRRRRRMRSLGPASPARCIIATAAVLTVALCQVAGCAGNGRETDQRQGLPIVLLGVDGLEWDVMLPLRERGELPNLSSLMARGVAGTLDTLTPTLSPVVWTTIATGKTSVKHGIPHFALQRPDGTIRLFTNVDRRTKALWNMLSDHRRR